MMNLSLQRVTEYKKNIFLTSTLCVDGTKSQIKMERVELVKTSHN